MAGRFRKIIIGALLAYTKFAGAADSYVVGASLSMHISEHGICSTVNNGGPQAIMVPTKASGEWSSFRTNPPPLVTLSSCCPQGYVMVPGDSEQGTTDFCVMQYEAKRVLNIPVSQPELPPWTSLNHADATARCDGLGPGYSLISNAQWQTVIRNAEYVDANWSGGARGVGCFMGGNNAKTSSCHYNRGSVDYGTSRDVKARHILSNGTIVWDFGGNVSEWVSGSFSGLTTSDYWNVGAPTLSAGLRVKFGTKGYYTFNGCGPLDNTPNKDCGVRGFVALVPSSSEAMRGGEYSDPHSDAFWTHLGLGNTTYPMVGFRCAFDITQPQEDPCDASSPSIGTTCKGGTKYAGSYSSGKYMTTPGGCGNSNTPTCTGTDSLTKTWRGSTGSSVDIPGVTNITAAGTPDNNLGSVNTAAIVANANTSSNSAAHYCDALEYGGYDDWYLPNKEELMLLYTNRVAIGGFDVNQFYYSSSEAFSTTGWAHGFQTNTQSQATKSIAYRVRCVRRY